MPKLLNPDADEVMHFLLKCAPFATAVALAVTRMASCLCAVTATPKLSIVGYPKSARYLRRLLTGVLWCAAQDATVDLLRQPLAGAAQGGLPREDALPGRGIRQVLPAASSCAVRQWHRCRRHSLGRAPRPHQACLVHTYMCIRRTQIYSL